MEEDQKQQKAKKDKKDDEGVGGDEQDGRVIPRPDISVAQIVLLILAETGRTDFKTIIKHPLVRSIGAVRSENSFYTALARLKRRKMITRSGDRVYELTGTGEYAALKAYVRKEFTESEKKESSSAKASEGSSRKREWDGKWRMVLFDIPESKRPIRDYIRGVLKRMGFREFQRSMWIYPYKLPPFLAKLMSDPQMRKYTRVITTYDIDYDEDLRRRFKLS
jgi:DNA-binding transcriptional regulator PaaX